VYVSDAEEIYPYLVPEAYFEATGNREGIAVSIGHGIYADLVFDRNGLVQGVSERDLAALAMTGAEAHARALANLAGLAEAQQIRTAVFPQGPQGHPFLLAGGHWAAATALLLPDLWAVASPALGSADLLASIPHREAMLVFARRDCSYRDAMRALVRQNESHGLKPLTFELFALAAGGVEPYFEV
jgi:hypothetical protein